MADAATTSPPKILISYSQDSDEHRERVRGLHASLSRDGCDCQLDAYKDTDEDWPLWMTRQLEEADFILCVITETYTRRFRDNELPNVGLGVGWEAGLIRRLLYAKKLHNVRIFPVLFARENSRDIPLELQGYDFFLLNNAAGYEALLRKVLGRPLYVRSPPGVAPVLSTTTTAPLFERPGATSPHTNVRPSPAPKVPVPGTVVGAPRVYVSYCLRDTPGPDAARQIADRLRAAGIDARIDHYYRENLHGFTAPPLLKRGEDAWTRWQREQIRDADRVVILCGPEYVNSPPDSGVAWDLQFMSEDLNREEVDLRKFVPAGFDDFGSNRNSIPAFIRGAHYYELGDPAIMAGLRHLVAQFKNEFPAQLRPQPAPPEPMSTRSIVWLHLSDLHNCKQRTGWDAHRVLKPLIRDLKHIEEKHGLIPQLLFFTGDAAFGNIGNVPGSTLPEQFDGAHELLEKVRTTYSTPVPKENVFIVPGNHDIDRDEVTPALSSWIAAQTPGTVTGVIQKAGKQWESYMDRLSAYREFLTRHGYDHLLSDRKRLIFSETRELHGVKFGIAGFNSAWTCGGDSERGRLWLGGDWQSGELLQHLDEVDVRIALIHHPFGWFVEWEDPTLRILFERDFNFHLHGHEHLGWVDAKADGHVRIAGGACYDKSDYENGYNLVRLDLDTGGVEVWLRRYDSQGGGWVPRVVSGRTDNDGCWRLGKLANLEPALAKAHGTNFQ